MKLPSRPSSFPVSASNSKLTSKARRRALRDSSLILTAGIAALLTATGTAANVTLNATDAIDTTSFNAAGHWDNGAAPSAANDYFTGAFTLRTPKDGGPYTFAGNSLTISAGGTFAFKISPVITINNLILAGGSLNNFDTGTDKVAKVAGTMTVTGTGSSINSSNAGRMFQIDSLFQGSGALSILGSGGPVTFTNAGNTYSGALTLGGTTVLAVPTISNGGIASPLGAATSDPANIVLNGGVLRTIGIAGSTDRLFTMNANGGIDSSGTGALSFTNTGAIAHTGTTAHVLTLTGTNTGNNTFAPMLGDGTSATGLTKTGNGTWILPGANGYTGTTTVNSGILRITNGGALGTTGGVTLAGDVAANNGTLELAGGITLTKNFTFAARQNTTANIPSIRSAGGDNTITGSLNLTVGGSFYNIESASAGETLTINGDINGSSLTTGNRQPRFMGSGNSVLNGNLLLPTGSGFMDLFKEGSGTLTLNGTATHTGGTFIRGGTLALGAAAALTGTNRIELANNATLNASAAGGVTLNPSAALSGSGNIVGNVSDGSGAFILPGGSGAAGTLTVTGDLALNGGATIDANFRNATTVGAGVNDLISVSGALTTSGTTTIEFHPLGSALAGSYRLISYGGSGALGGSYFVSNNTRYTVATDTATAGQVNVVVTGSAGSLTWSGSSADWDTLLTPNWNGGADVFFEADNVTFDGTAANPAVNLVGTLRPGSVTVSGAVDQFFNGTGSIAGGAGLTKTGNGKLTISTANTFDGEVNVSGGTLIVNNVNALGSTVGGTTVASGGTLDLNALLLPAGETVTISGAGVGGAGAIVNNGLTGGVGVGLKKLVLSGDSAIGGTQRWDIRDVPGGLDAAAKSLTKVGLNTIFFKDLGETHLGNVIVSDGTLGLEGNTTLGDGAGTVQVAPAGTLSLFNSTGAGTKTVALQGGTIGTLTGAGTANVLNGNVDVQAASKFSLAASTTARVNGKVTGNGALSVEGGGTLEIGGTVANDNTGTTTVTAGKLRLVKTAGTPAIAGSVIAAGGTLAMGAANQFGPNASVTINTGGTWSNGSNFAQTLANLTVNTATLQSINAVNVTNLFSITAGNHDLNSGQSATANAMSISGNANFRLGANGTASTMNIGPGGLMLDNGTLQLGQTGGAVTARVNLNGDLTGSGTSTISNPNTTGPRILDLVGGTRVFNITSGTTTISPTIQNGGLTKDGAGTLVLSGPSSYNSATTILAGTLLVNGSISGSAVTVGTSGTLGGTGTINGNVAVNGLLSPGVSVGTLTLGSTDLTFGSNASSTFELSSNAINDAVSGINQLTLDGTFVVTLFGGYNPVAGDSFDLFNAANVVATGFNLGTDLSLPALNPGLAWNTDTFVSNGVLTVVPEPSTAMTLLGGLSVLFGARRSRRRK